MESWLKKRNIRRARRVKSIQKRIRGSEERPRLCINKTCKHIHAQVINDNAGITFCSVSTLEKALRETKAHRSVMSAVDIGRLLAQRLQETGIKALCVDRRHAAYHGIVCALVEELRKSGISV